MSYPPEIKRALRFIMLSQCVGMVATVLFANGFMLAYVIRLGFPAHRVLFIFALMPLIDMVLTLPLAWLADRMGKVKLGLIGQTVSLIGFMMIPMASLMSQRLSGWCLNIGFVVFSIGTTAIGASWFALLSSIIPVEIRGRWLGKMQTAWRTTTVVFSLIVAALLYLTPELYVFQLVLVASGALLLVRRTLYKHIPELDPVRTSKDSFFKTMGSLFRIPGYLRFGIYLFILSATGAVNGLLSLMQKDALGFSDSLVLLLGNLLAIGAVAGFLIGGKMVDSQKLKLVLLLSHVLTAAILIGILLRGVIPVPLPVTMSLFSLSLGAVQGAAGIALTSELFALIPPENKSLSTGFIKTLMSAGIALAGLLCGLFLKLNVLPVQWTLLQQTLNAYDVLLIGFLGVTLLLAAALGLVPTIRHLRRQWIPQTFVS